MAEPQNLSHSLSLQDRKKLTLTGITEVISFDETAVVMHTPLGALIAQGDGLRLKTLTPEGGNVTITGEITALSYEQERAAGGWLHRLLG